MKNINQESQEIINKIHAKFDSEIITKLDKKQVSNSPINIINRSFNLLHLSNELLGVVPEILCGYIAGGKLREEVILKNAENCLSLKDREGVLLCHALSPYSESIGFYCDIGRAYRISRGLSIPIKVMLANREWTNYNWVVNDLKLKNNLAPNEDWRKKVYSELLNVEADSRSIYELKNEFNIDIDSIAGEYVTLILKIFGGKADLKKYSDEEIDKMLEDKNFLFELAQLKILNKDIQPIITTIKCVLRNFKRVDLETFIYFLTQYYHQSRYNGYIKISMKREKDFDDSFIEIYNSNNSSQFKHENLIGLYLEDYKYGHKDGVHLTAHPYYFPSGTIYSICKDNIEEAVNSCIMISDFNNKDKIKKILGNLNYFQRARIVSDLLSFAHALSQKHEFARQKVSSWFKKNKPNYYFYSWETFTNKSNNNLFSIFVNNWTNLVFTKWANHQNFPIPYWFLPYFWDNDNEESSSFVSIDDQVELVSLILTSANNCLSLPLLPVTK